MTIMKQVSILTYYQVHNHGALLQAYALKQTLENEGCSVNFLSFERNYDFIEQNEKKKYKLSFNSIFYYIKYLFKKGPANIFFNLKKNRLLKTFRKSSFIMKGDVCKTKNEIVIIGSDEVFALDVGYNPFMYGNGVLFEKCFSYAGCFGSTVFDFFNKHIDIKNEIIDGFSKMSSIGVRDNNSFRIVKELGFNPTLVCDPVILYGYYKEQNIKHKKKKKPYLLIYSYDKNLNDKGECENIINFAKSKGLSIFSVGFHHKWCDKNINCDPLSLIGWFKNASYVITDTFHGAVLSIICNVDFAVKMRNNSNKLGFLLEEYGLKDRILTSILIEELERVFSQKIHYESVNNLIKIKRNQSLDFLKRNINNETN